MDELPELPFEQVLSYLSLEDRLKARAVSRRWYHQINRFRVNTLCYSTRSRDFIWGKNRWVSGVFAENFISSTRFTTFFDTFGQTILSNLKHLRLCGIDLSERDRAAFTRILNSFGQLEQLDIIRVGLIKPVMFKLNLNLPMLTRLQLEKVEGFWKLTLEAPRLREVKILDCSALSVEIVHSESVERLLVDRWEYTEVKKLKNLQYLYVASLPDIDSTLLSSLQHLKEIHTNKPGDVSKLLTEKQRSGRDELKIYLYGLLLNGPHDPAMNALGHSSGEWLVCLAENRSRLADQIPLCRFLYYTVNEGITPGLEVDLLKVFTDLNNFLVYYPVQDIERFLNLLKNCENIIVELEFDNDHPQDLFDRLPEHCAIQRLTLYRRPSDLAFLFRLKHLIHLSIDCSIDIEIIRRALEELPLLMSFKFRYGQKRGSIEIGQSNKFYVLKVGDKMRAVFDLNAAIEFIAENEG